ncbi:MAG: hypothetical protein RL538_483, partial [Candidatus Parcubacteria bacterium]
LKLKSPPKDVIYSQAYKTRRGDDEVKYAYLADEVPPAQGEDISRRTPDSQTEVLEVIQEGDKKIEKLKTTFYTSPQMYEDDTGKWRQIEYATTTAEVFSRSGAIPHIKRRELVEWILPGKPLYAATATYYPVSGTSVDGYVTSTVAGWAGAHDAVTGTAVDEAAVTFIAGAIDLGVYTIVTIHRGFLLFSTSALSDDADISAATLDLYATAKTNTDNDGTDKIDIVTSTPASNTTLATADFDAVGTTLQATSIDVTSITTSSDNTFTLNATGRGNISLTGMTKFGVREGHDTGNTAPGLSTGNSVTFSSSDETGTAQDPTLTVTYTVPTFSMGQWFPF